MNHSPIHFKLELSAEIGPNLSRVLVTLFHLTGRLMALAPFFFLSGSTPGG
ncbi:MAG: hypothetical protein JKP96_07340 [Oceanicaulis sp.]|jgi:hypothetical protein|nr:hypothetical protein [Oceanicaulis sp.]